MKIIFCGTPDFAVPSLRKIAALAPKHELLAVVSQPDRPKGRSHTPTPPPVVEAARALGFPNERIFQPKTINRPEVLEALRALKPDLLCVIAYGSLFKGEALALAKLFPINAHASLLPRHRGAAPIQAALLAGDAETGVSVMKLEAGLDTGPVLLQQSIPISPDDDAGALHDKLAELSAACFVEAVTRLESGPCTFTPQDDSRATYAAKLEKSSGQIEWQNDAVVLERFIRAMNPWPGAWTTISTPDDAKSQRMRVVKATLLESGGGVTGEAHVVGDGEVACFKVACGSGALLIRQIQPEGKRAMSVAEFLRGAGRQFQPESRWL